MERNLLDKWGIDAQNFTNNEDALVELQKLLLRPSLVYTYVTIYLHKEEVGIALFDAGALEANCSAPTVAKAIYQAILSWVKAKEEEDEEDGGEPVGREDGQSKNQRRE